MKLFVGIVALISGIDATCSPVPTEIMVTTSDPYNTGKYTWDGTTFVHSRPKYDGPKAGMMLYHMWGNWRLEDNVNGEFAIVDNLEWCYPGQSFTAFGNTVSVGPYIPETSNKKTTDAVAEVINCNDDTTKAVQIKAAITNPTNDLDVTNGWAKDGGKWIKTYALADLGTPEFIKDGGEDWMVLTATEGTTGCEKIKVDGVDVCKDIGESFSFKCKYNLKDQTIKDTFSVTGQDTEATAEGTGTLSYTIEVDKNVQIGDTVSFTIKPASPGLVFATATECNVKFSSQEVTIFGHETPKCTTSAVGATWDTSNDKASSKTNIKGEWTAFKWFTSTTKTDAESQTFECTIALSKDQETTPVTNCPSSG